jgi:hypothetical protein
LEIVGDETCRPAPHLTGTVGTVRQIDRIVTFAYRAFVIRAVSVKFCTSRTWEGDTKVWMVTGGGTLVGASVVTVALP